MKTALIQTRRSPDLITAYHPEGESLTFPEEEARQPRGVNPVASQSSEAARHDPVRQEVVPVEWRTRRRA